MTDQIAYKVMTAADVVALRTGSFAGAPVDLADGFIHLSTAAQLTETVTRHFAGQEDLTIAAVDLAALGGLVRWEASRHGQLFPHLYGSLTPAMIVGECPLAWDSDGGVRLPGVPAARSTVFYDGGCPVCSREIAFYRARPGAEEFDWVNVLTSTPAALGPALSREAALARMHVRLADGTLVSGAAAFAAMWRQMPGFRILGRIVSIPPFGALAEFGYLGFLRFRKLWR